MSNIIHAAMTFALLHDGRMVHIDDVRNGARCGCICPQCKKSLIAKNGGQERAHHFAHEDATECERGAETALHLASKQIVVDHKRLALPFSLENVNEEDIRFIEFDNVQTEHILQHPLTQQRVIADCYGENIDGPFVVEIAVHHRVEGDKATMLDSIGVSAIEIDLSDLIGELIDWDRLRCAVLMETFRRHWISTNPVQETLPLAEQHDASEMVSSTPRSREWCFAIGKTWVWVREFQSGDLSVFHRYDQRVRAVVEPLCRSRGYWNARYKNWIVFKQFKAELLELLGRQGHVVNAPSW